MEKFAIGIDIGGTNTKMGIVSESGRVFNYYTLKTSSYQLYNDFIMAISEVINTIKKDYPSIEGIGIGAPNANYYSGIIENAPNLIWKHDLPIASDIEKLTKLRTLITNDANAATIGEKIYGAAKDFTDFIMITLGTGLGSGFYVNNKMVYGLTGSAGELGHTIIVPQGRQCNCSKMGCLETYCSASGLVQTYWEISKSSNELITAKDIYELAIDNDKAAIRAFDLFTNYLAIGVSNAILITSPQAVIIFGGLAAAEEFIIKPLENKVNKLLLPNFRGKTIIKRSELPESSAAILGAASLVFNK